MTLVSRRTLIKLLGSIPVSVAIPAVLQASVQEPQPHMRAALTALQSAKRHLEVATADKGGHRVKAIGHVDAALEEVRLGIEADNRR